MDCDVDPNFPEDLDCIETFVRDELKALDYVVRNLFDLGRRGCGQVKVACTRRLWRVR